MIRHQFADTGHWLARCNHQTGVIELNAREFDSLSPMMKDYVWVHECVHLIGGVTDEAECNRISDEIFLSRAKGRRDREKRQEFVVAANDQSFTMKRTPVPGMTSTMLILLVAVCVYVLIKK